MFCSRNVAENEEGFTESVVSEVSLLLSIDENDFMQFGTNKTSQISRKIELLIKFIRARQSFALELYADYKDDSGRECIDCLAQKNADPRIVGE